MSLSETTLHKNGDEITQKPFEKFWSSYIQKVKQLEKRLLKERL